MPKTHRIKSILFLTLVSGIFISRADEASRLAELDVYWADVARCVKEGDFKGYEASIRSDGVLVTGIKKQSYPLAKALARWKKEFDDTKAGTRKSNLTLRFSQRVGDDTTAHETGIFLYEATMADGTSVKEYIHFESLLLKGDHWKTMMEYQKSKATEAEWNALAK
ncbi:MAG: hypothetical protein WCT04_18845 [Planctomycetota bacterium]